MADQKVVIVTGAGSGIGRATAAVFANAGYAVVLNGRTKEKLEQSADQLDSNNALIVVGDVSKSEDVSALIQSTIEAFGRIDVLVNNAGVAVFNSLDNITLDEFQNGLAVNVNGPFMAIKAALPHLEKTRGAIVNVSSVSGIGGDWGGFAYNTTKGALNLMTKGLALDLAPRGIRINAVAPSLTVTDMSKGVVSNEHLMEKFKNRMPMKRAAKPEEVADVIFYLASEKAQFVNGVIMPVDGGLSASNGQPNMMG
ncbi:SDR family NAD(P)-dependent oxidoreductase [Aestuariibacter salexigens]|uniref:SDR family NAD(P)-dependent oxidoreductase n=1 Tax=Aestuariibacter salexigens TaxID=226010 RepID=UPI0003F8462A|nr:SDR family oxidoreductase [Aestuariibacter salexigens]